MSGPDEEGTAVNTRKVAAAFLSNPDTRGVTSSFLSPPGLIRGSMPWPGAMSPAWGMGCRVLGPSWGERPQPLFGPRTGPWGVAGLVGKRGPNPSPSGFAGLVGERERGPNPSPSGKWPQPLFGPRTGPSWGLPLHAGATSMVGAKQGSRSLFDPRTGLRWTEGSRPLSGPRTCSGFRLAGKGTTESADPVESGVDAAGKEGSRLPGSRSRRAPTTKRMPTSLAATCARTTPASVLRSVSAIAARPSSAARRTSSSGCEPPRRNEKLLVTCSSA